MTSKRTYLTKVQKSLSEVSASVDLLESVTRTISTFNDFEKQNHTTAVYRLRALRNRLNSQIEELEANIELTADIMNDEEIIRDNAK